MMNIFTYFYIVLIVNFLQLGFMTSTVGQDEDVIASARTAIKQGNAKNLSSYFNELVELNFDDEKSSYSKTQAEFVLKEFFKKYPAKDFRYIHKGASKEGLLYAIGKYTYEGGSFRVYILVKQMNGKYIIDTIDFGED
ncbi:DUF4783 domain-containing protein [Rapidithrix thailandica]|uniref:DUF4783 domain-containing protein n=1 Tax=Rapidithrix thailandica TaxID=413964 RepID=A0AAW9S9U4_9BACT